MLLLLGILVVWLAVLGLAVAACRMAARGDLVAAALSVEEWVPTLQPETTATANPS